VIAPAASRVFLVDDDASVRKSLARLVKAAGYEAEVFASVRDFLARAPYDGPCCLVLDVRMPGLTGLDLQDALRAAGQRLSIVFITGYRDVRVSVKAMKGGAVDFLTKPVDEETLLGAIRQAVARTLADRRQQARVTEIRRRIATLTPREAAVFALVVTGMLNKQIGSELGIAEKTVKVHRARVMEKMQAGSLAELVRLAGEGSVVTAGA
jgi:FixJ family two-component response regulator